MPEVVPVMRKHNIRNPDEASPAAKHHPSRDRLLAQPPPLASYDDRVAEDRLGGAAQADALSASSLTRKCERI